MCPDTTGKDLFDGLKRACGHYSKHLLQSIGWPCLITNGIAYGLASMSHGGRDHTTLPNWTLSVAQAVTATPKDFDHYEMPKDDKVEAKPRTSHPLRNMAQASAERDQDAWGALLGLEHRPGRLKALEQIEQAHEADPEAWPEAYCYSLWEELKAAWVEELREGRRRLCKLLKCETTPEGGSPVCRAGTREWLHISRPLSSSTIPKATTRRSVYQGSRGRSNRLSSDSCTTRDMHPPRSERTRTRRGPVMRRRMRALVKADAGKRLRPKEASDSVRHGPKTKEGKLICWDSACHSGCQRTPMSPSTAHGVSSHPTQPSRWEDSPIESAG